MQTGLQGRFGCKQSKNSKTIFNVFGLDDTLPIIITSKEFASHKSINLYSGVENINKASKAFTKGSFKLSKQASLGHGYYFSTDIEVAKKYAKNNSQENVIIAKLLENAKIMKSDEYYEKRIEALNANRKSIIDTITPHDKYKKKLRIVSELLGNTFGVDALIPILYGYDGISKNLPDNSTEYNIIRRNVVVLPLDNIKL